MKKCGHWNCSKCFLTYFFGCRNAGLYNFELNCRGYLGYLEYGKLCGWYLKVDCKIWLVISLKCVFDEDIWVFSNFFLSDNDWSEKKMTRINKVTQWMTTLLAVDVSNSDLLLLCPVNKEPFCLSCLQSGAEADRSNSMDQSHFHGFVCALKALKIDLGWTCSQERRALTRVTLFSPSEMFSIWWKVPLARL